MTIKKINLHKIFLCLLLLINSNIIYSMLRPNINKTPLQKTTEKSFFNETCYICNHIFKGKEALKKHLNTFHKSLKHTCTLCQKNYSSIQTLEKHIKKIHSNNKALEKPHYCLYCAHTFCNKIELRLHLAMHENREIFSCNACDRKFLTQSSYSDHIKKIHQEVYVAEKKFSCLHCPDTFRTKTEQKQHIAIHENKKIFLCLYCGKNFLTQTGYNHHIQKYHNPTIYTTTQLHLNGPIIQKPIISHFDSLDTNRYNFWDDNYPTSNELEEQTMISIKPQNDNFVIHKNI